MAHEGTAMLAPNQSDADAFGAIVRLGLDPNFVDAPAPIEAMAGLPTTDPATEATLGSMAAAPAVEHPFGDGFLVSLPEAAGRKRHEPTPAKVEITGQDADGNITDVRTSAPD